MSKPYIHFIGETGQGETEIGFSHVIDFCSEASIELWYREATDNVIEEYNVGVVPTLRYFDIESDHPVVIREGLFDILEWLDDGGL